MSGPRLATSLRGFAHGAVSTLRTRLELLGVELQEEKLRAAGFLFDTVLAALCIGFALVFAAVFVTVLLWDSHRELALGASTALLLVAGLTFAGRAAGRLRATPKLFSASLAELQHDRDALDPRGDA